MLNGKLTFWTWSSKLDSCATKVEIFDFQDTRIEDQEWKIKNPKNEELWIIDEL